MTNLQDTKFIVTIAETAYNRDDLTDLQLQEGVVYKSNIISTNVNDIYYKLSQGLQYLQFTGGLYNSTVPYDLGNIATVMRQVSGVLQLWTFSRGGDNVDKTINNPPVINTTTVIRNGVTVYIDGDLNPDWIIVSVPSDIFKQRIQEIQNMLDTHIADTSIGVHGGTPEAIASRLIQRDADGYAKILNPSPFTAVPPETIPNMLTVTNAIANAETIITDHVKTYTYIVDSDEAFKVMVDASQDGDLRGHDFSRVLVKAAADGINYSVDIDYATLTEYQDASLPTYYYAFGINCGILKLRHMTQEGSTGLDFIITGIVSDTPVRIPRFTAISGSTYPPVVLKDRADVTCDIKVDSVVNKLSINAIDYINVLTPRVCNLVVSSNGDGDITTACIGTNNYNCVCTGSARCSEGVGATVSVGILEYNTNCSFSGTVETLTPLSNDASGWGIGTDNLNSVFKGNITTMAIGIGINQRNRFCAFEGDITLLPDSNYRGTLVGIGRSNTGCNFNGSMRNSLGDVTGIQITNTSCNFYGEIYGGNERSLAIDDGNASCNFYGNITNTQKTASSVAISYAFGIGGNNYNCGFFGKITATHPNTPNRCIAALMYTEARFTSKNCTGKAHITCASTDGSYGVIKGAFGVHDVYIEKVGANGILAIDCNGLVNIMYSPTAGVTTPTLGCINVATGCGVYQI